MYSSSSQVALYSFDTTNPPTVLLNNRSHFVSPWDHEWAFTSFSISCIFSASGENLRVEPNLVFPESSSLQGLYFSPKNFISFCHTQFSLIGLDFSVFRNIPFPGSSSIFIGFLLKNIPSSA